MQTRRQVLDLGLWIASSAALASVGCATCPAPSPSLSTPQPQPQPPEGPPPGLLDPDLTMLRTPPGPLTIVQRVPGQAGILRRRARMITDSDLEHVTTFERRMRETLESTDGGVGLAGPQVGVGARAILVMIDARGEKPHVEFFLNPRIVERSDDITADYEGCLSIPGLCGLVKRNRRVVVEHGLIGRRERIEAQDFDARIFQHEIDHLDGVLYVDRVDGEIHPRERLKELREKLREQQPKVACTPMLRGRYRDEVLL